MKTKLIILLTFVIYLNSNAQIGFEDHVIIDGANSANGANCVYSSDIDGDGDMDILSAAGADDKIAWYENIDGNGKFSTSKLIVGSTDYPESIYTADIDGDGDQDVLSASSYDDKIAWYENTDGLGTFGEQQIITTLADRAKSVFATDIDGDGDMDVISASYGDDKIAWYENTNGLGAFGEQQIIAIRNGAKSVLAEDVDGDGDMDVLSLSEGNISWHENTNGLGSFTSHSVYSTGASLGSFYVTDVDGDGDIDVISGAYDNSLRLNWHENIDGNGTFSSYQTISADIGASSVFAEDIDGDGDVDIISASTNQITWFENIDGNETFETYHTINTNIDYLMKIFAADLDGDGDMDLLSASRTDDKIAWYQNIDGNGEFSTQKVITVHADGPNSIIAADIDGDGDMDVLASSENDMKVSWYENINGEISYTTQKNISTSAAGASSIYAADMDGDGNIDILSAEKNSNRLRWYKNTDGSGNFVGYNITSNAMEPDNIIAVDIDGDGDLDVLSTTEIGTLGWYENLNGECDFSTVHSIFTNGEDFSISVADLDGDLDMDILAISTYTIYFIKNSDGLGNFAFEDQVEIADNLNFVKDVFASDIDGDGDMDILFASSGDDKIAWYENIDGYGTFGEQQVITNVATNAYLVYTCDIDNDGDLDVLSSSIYDNKISWYENIDGQGNFGTQQFISTNANKTESIYATDIDGDGDQDILSASTYYDKIIWHENLGINKNEIIGIIRLDNNMDGCDNSDDLVSEVMVSTSNGTETMSTFSNSNGLFQIFTEEGDFSTKLPNIPDYFNLFPPSHNSNFVGVTNIDTANFCIQPNQIVNDLNIEIFPMNNAMPGYNAKYKIICNNVGTSQIDATVVLKFDGMKLDFINASEPISSFSYDSLVFELSNFNPFLENKIIDIEFYVNPPYLAEIGDILQFQSTVFPIENDNSENDNVFIYYQTVVGSYDPNDITVLEGEQILLENADEYLHYLIRFQNTGTAHAIKVVVNNALDDKLDWNTLQIEDISHDNRVEIKNANQVSFIFDAIYLPDSTSNEPESHGYIAYKIKPKSDVILGDIISNQADIFFDFNPAVATNTVSTKIVNPDTEAPIAVCQDTNVYLDINGEAVLISRFIDNGSTDNRRIVSYNANPNTFNCSDLGNVNVILTVKDEAENSDNCTAIVTVIDSLSPIADIETLTNITAECEITELISPTATDNCASSISGTHNSTLPITAQGTTVITWAYDDGNGNISTQTQNVVIDDITAPTVVTQNISIDLNGAASISILPEQIDNSSFDNCSINSLSLDIDNFTSVGEYQVVLTVEDVNGNISTGNAIVNVFDSTIGINNITSDEELIIYPNPANDLLIVKAINERIVTIIIYSVNGEKVKEVSTEIIDISKLSKGSYFVKITTENGKDILGNFVKK